MDKEETRYIKWLKEQIEIEDEEIGRHKENLYFYREQLKEHSPSNY